MADQREAVVGIVQAVARMKTPLAIGPGESLFDSGILDSFALPELVTALEQTFGITIPDADLSAQTFESVDQIVAYLQRRA
jgi:acyl carrier protein